MQGGFNMEELKGRRIRITLTGHTGFISYTGKFVSCDQNFVLVETTLGPIYIQIQVIKTIQIVGNSYEER